MLHINAKGDIEKCNATQRECPLENYPDQASAEQALEQQYSATITNNRAHNKLQQAKAQYGDFVTPYKITLPESVETTLKDLNEIGNPLIVGGTVRDHVGGFGSSNDVDIEVHNVTIEKLVIELKNRGYQVDEVGQQFGVLKVKKGNTPDLDISVPRIENKTGTGHQSFEVIMDENMTVEEAATRRDFTINAIMYDHKLNVIIDPNNGQQDYNNRILRHVSEKFQEDPLRSLRGFQFAARFNMTYAPETAKMCKSLRNEFKNLSTERVQHEWDKFYTQGTKLSAGVKALQDSGWNDTAKGLQQALQDKQTVQALDNVPKLPLDKRTLMGTSIIAKKISDKPKERQEFIEMSIIGKREQRKVETIAKLSESDLDSTYNRKQTARKLHSVGLTLRDIHLYSTASGNTTMKTYAQQAINEGIGDKPEQDLVSGNDISAITDKEKGPWVKIALEKARDAQYKKEVTNKAEAVVRLKEIVSELEHA